ncbi:MAG: U32 family peptidase [Nanoarchaeota archaeon]
MVLTKNKYELLTRSPTFKQNKAKGQKMELLAPAGSFPSLIAAVNAGADAVYFGLQEGMNMRANAKNFSIKDLPKVVEICKPRNVKKYLTLNTIVYDNELGKVEKLIKNAKKYVDAIICWDLSVIQLCKKHKIPFHISTQASISNVEAAKFYKKLGAERIILARELNIKQIAKIAKIIPVEVFVHGAMCVSVSGRCFTSQFLFGKSANRGECLQPCRRAYVVRDEDGNELKLENNTVMSAKDLCSLEFIEQLKKAEVKAFKIEGRNREPEYVSTVTHVYRKALDKKLTGVEIKESIKQLSSAYNKGFSSGFYLGNPTVKDFSNAQHSSATQRKEFIGTIYHYFPEVSVAAIKISSGVIKVGDELIIIGDKTGMITHKIERIEINHQPYGWADKGQEVGIKIPGVRKGDKVYLIVKK